MNFKLIVCILFMVASAYVIGENLPTRNNTKYSLGLLFSSMVIFLVALTSTFSYIKPM